MLQPRLWENNSKEEGNTPNKIKHCEERIFYITMYYLIHTHIHTEPNYGLYYNYSIVIYGNTKLAVVSDHCTLEI